MALRRVAVPLLLTVLVAAGCSKDNNKTASTTSESTTSTVAAPKDIQIGAGMNDPKDPNVAVLQFMPAKVTVAVGTPVNWTWSGTEPHSVTFLAPGTTLPDPSTKAGQAFFAPTPPTGPYAGTTLVNSGLQPLGPTAPAPLQITFSKAGDYTYHCVIHPNMSGQITVANAGATTIDTPASVAARRATESAAWLAEGQAAKAKLLATPAAPTKNADGSMTWTIAMGASTAHTDVLAFAPTPAAVKAGDTVTFVNGSGAPHTASFFGTGSSPITSPLDPRTDVAAPGKSPQTLSATGLFNTGTLPPNAPPGQGPPLAARSFSFKVAKAGTYSYVCIFHASSSMTGAITAT